MSSSKTAMLGHWTMYTPIVALVVLGLAGWLPYGASLAVCAAALAGAVFSAVHHAERVRVLGTGLVVQFGLSSVHALQGETQLFDEGDVGSEVQHCLLLKK